MSRERYTAGYTPSAARKGPSRLAGFIYIILALLLVGLAAGNHPIAIKLRGGLMDVVSPSSALLSAPVTSARNVLNDKNRLLEAFEENKTLRTEVESLRSWQSVAQALKAENNALRALAGYQPVERAKYITARVVGQSPGGFRSTLLINAGSAEGVGELQPVIDASGMIGRITELGTHSARVLLLTDSNSHVPVVSADTRVHAILNGTGEELMQLSFLGQDADKISIGEHIVTTEEAGLVPGGIMVGTVFKRENQNFFIKPGRSLTQSEYVRVVVAHKEEETAPPAPTAQ